MALNPDRFAKIADSLRQYRRAELSDFQSDIGTNPVELLYVDPLESNAVLKTVMLNNTTFLIGRKGTGKSTVFAKAQIELRKREDAISIYVDVKSLHELLSTNEAVVQTIQDASISEPVFRAHSLRKGFLGAVISDLIKELKNAYEARSLIQRWIGKARGYHDVIAELEKLAADVKVAKLTQEEIPILRVISAKAKEAKKTKESVAANAKAEAKLAHKSEIKASAGMETFDESIADNELYQEYADAVLRSFPFQELLSRIRELLGGVGLVRLFVFFDDFSELAWIDQKLFVDVILSPLNNASDETIKLKVAGYPGRIYYGKIDPGKIDIVGLDFYQLYKSQEIQNSETAAINYLERLLATRFHGFKENIAEYFDTTTPLADHYRSLFEVTLNVPRLIGYVLHYCYLDRVSKRQVITGASIRLAAQKYYETVIVQYFDRMNRFAMEPFERKLDRHNQQQLLRCLVEEARTVRRGITTGQIGGKFFDGLTNPPVSHFAVNPSMEKLLSALELNFLVTKYHEMRDKSGKDVSVYAFFYGLCEAERFPWGYPKGRRDDRSYFVQRCFNYNAAIQLFLSKNQTIRCDTCGACFAMEKRDTIEFYKWRCPECQTGTCAIVSLSDDFKREVETLKKDTMLPPVELEILESLNEEGVPMRAGEIAALVDVTHQLVGHRTSKLHEMGLVHKAYKDGVNRSTITDKARQRYFGLAGNQPTLVESDERS
ncbi:MAG: transcriptional regulator [Verrucomicrobia bacterium]|nr:transcriptional regulator [Verrucomicrobiota bacterium]